MVMWLKSRGNYHARVAPGGRRSIQIEEGGLTVRYGLSSVTIRIRIPRLVSLCLLLLTSILFYAVLSKRATLAHASYRLPDEGLSYKRGISVR